MTPYGRFKREALRLAAELGLGDWRTDFCRKRLADAEKICEVHIDLTQKSARFTWNLACRPKGEKKFDELDTAAHEILHVALFELLAAAASSRSYDSPRVDALEHAFINRVAPFLAKRKP